MYFLIHKPENKLPVPSSSNLPWWPCELKSFVISNCKYHKSIHTRTWNITWEYKERWNFLASSNWDISPSITLVIFITSGEPTISRNLREMIVRGKVGTHFVWGHQKKQIEKKSTYVTRTCLKLILWTMLHSWHSLAVQVWG